MEGHTPGDEALMAEAAHGSRSAFGALFTRHEARLVAFLTRFTGDSHLAQDAAQTAFLNAWEARTRFDAHRGSFRVWLWTLGKNAARTELTRRHRTDLPLESAAEQTVPDGASQRLLQRAVSDALGTLREKERLALVLTVYEGFTFREAAYVLGGTEIAARVLCHRARQRLKVQLSPLLEREDYAPKTC
jgi:RNA polymerase sigma-70 factor, ECF subfamily